MKWHHLTGLVGGIFVITWVFSGWMSMSPWGGLRDADGHIGERYAASRPGFVATDLARLTQTAKGVREVGFGYLGGAPVMIALDETGARRLLEGGTTRPLSLPVERILAMAERAVPGGRPVSVERLERYDRYWYATGDPRQDSRPLPVLRVAFDDPAQTWLHIDPATGMLLNTMGSGSRSYRWLFAALHRFDLPWLLVWGPLREGLIWLLSAAGLVVSVSGIVVGLRHLRGKKRPRRTV
jgi:hypothetical protein